MNGNFEWRTDQVRKKDLILTSQMCSSSSNSSLKIMLICQISEFDEWFFLFLPGVRAWFQDLI